MNDLALIRFLLRFPTATDCEGRQFIVPAGVGDLKLSHRPNELEVEPRPTGKSMTLRAPTPAVRRVRTT
jgi:uncharacterized protein YjlB